MDDCFYGVATVGHRLSGLARVGAVARFTGVEIAADNRRSALFLNAFPERGAEIRPTAASCGAIAL